MFFPLLFVLKKFSLLHELDHISIPFRSKTEGIYLTALQLWIEHAACYLVPKIGKIASDFYMVGSIVDRFLFNTLQCQETYKYLLIINL